jgi:predicted DNA-binding transcriptional regulator YafY
MARGNQVVRQWRLLHLVSRPDGLTIDAAARELACTVRTIWRDLRSLQDAGYPIYDERAENGRSGLWKVEAGFQARLPVPLALDEMVALALATKLLTPAGGNPIGPALASLAGKFRALLAPRALALLDGMAERVGVRAPGAKPAPHAAGHLPVIQSALREQRALRVRYYSMSRGVETDRRVDPYQLTYFNGGLYLVAYCHLRRAVLIFAVERIRAIELLPATFEIPVSFDVGRYLESAWGLMRGEIVTVTARFSKAVAPYVRERVWHPSQQVRDLPDGRIEVTVRVADTIEVRRWLLGFGADAEVLAPPALRDALRVEAERLAVRLTGVRKPPARAPKRARSQERRPA